MAGQKGTQKLHSPLYSAVNLKYIRKKEDDNVASSQGLPRCPAQSSVQGSLAFLAGPYPLGRVLTPTICLSGPDFLSPEAAFFSVSGLPPDTARALAWRAPSGGTEASKEESLSGLRVLPSYLAFLIESKSLQEVGW